MKIIYKSEKITGDTLNDNHLPEVVAGGFPAQAKQHLTRNHLTFPHSEWTDVRPRFQSPSPYLHPPRTLCFLYHTFAD